MKPLNIDDLRRKAHVRLPRLFFDYLDGGALSESTLRANVADFSRWTLMPKVLSGVDKVDLSTRFLGQIHAMPLVLGPIGFAGMLSYRGEVATARAAESAGIPTCVSSFSICRLEDVATSTTAPVYYQLYMLRNRQLCEDMIARAQAAGIGTLVLTVDTPVTPLRERDARNGFRASNHLSFSQMRDLLCHPRWCLQMARGGAPAIGNLRDYGMGRGLMAQASALATQIDPSLRWEDLTWLRQRWSGRLVIKGIMSPTDAQRARDCGADGLIVSNHGGRQLDGAPSTISVLRSIALAVGEEMEIFMDGGVRRGADVVKALAMGAHGVVLGRAYAYGLAAGGRAGVEDAIEIIRQEIVTTMTLMGVANVTQLRQRGMELIRADQAKGSM